MAGLAGIFVDVIAMLPFEKGNLLREQAELSAAGRERFGVERVAGGAESRIANVRFLSRTKAAGGGLHDAGLAVFNWEWPVLRMIVLGLWRVDDKLAAEGFASAEFFFGDLMADGAGDAIFGGSVFFGIIIEGKMRKDCT